MEGSSLLTYKIFIISIKFRKYLVLSQISEKAEKEVRKTTNEKENNPKFCFKL